MSNNFLLHAVESMSRIAPISYRRIFSGYAIYHQGVQFAIIAHDRLYFRADENSRSIYIAKHMTAFLPATISPDESNFFQLPDEVLSHPAELIFWMRIAVEAAQGGHSAADEDLHLKITPRHLKLR